MADISPVPYINFNQAGLTAAETDVQQQQANAAAMQNQIMAAKLPMMLEAFKGAEGHITDFSGQHNGEDVPAPDYNPASDRSGVSSFGGNANIRVTPYDMVGRNPDQTNIAQGAVQNKYNVDPSGTPQEQGKIRTAYEYAQRMKLLGDKGLSDSADAQLDAAKYERDMAVKDRQNQANLDASKYYEALNSVSTADHPWQLLYAVDKVAAMRLKALNPNADDDTLDQIAQNSAGQTGAFIHRFTGRGMDVGKDGITRDHDTQQPVLSVSPQGFSADEINNIRKYGNESATRTVNGREITKKNYEWAGYDNVDQYTAKSVVQARAVQASENRIESQRQNAVAIQAHLGIPPDQRIPSPGQTTPASVAADQANTPAAQGAAASRQMRAPTAPPPPATVVPPPRGRALQKGQQAPAPMAMASANSPSGNLDFSDATKSSTPNTPGQGLPAGAKANDADNAYWGELRKKNAEVGQTVGGANTAIQIATNAQNALNNDAATGSSAATRQWVATALGNPASLRFMLGDATSSAILRKMLGNAAFEQLETDANGNQMRLGSQTIRVAMTQLSASPEMTPDAIRALTGQMIKNANYEKQKGADYARYKGAGNDVTSFDQWYNTKYPNKTTIDTGQSGAPIRVKSRAEAMALTPGTEFVTPDGRHLVR